MEKLGNRGERLGGALPWRYNPACTMIAPFDVSEEEKALQERNYRLARTLGISSAQISPRLKDRPSRGTGDIWAAAREGNLSRVKYLIDVEGVPVNRNRWSGVTAMHRAAEEGRLEVLGALTTRGGAVDAKTTWGWQTPLMLACGRGHYEAALLLLESGAKWETVDKTGKTALEYAIIGGYAEMARKLDNRYLVLSASARAAAIQKKQGEQDALRQKAVADRAAAYKERREQASRAALEAELAKFDAEVAASSRGASTDNSRPSSPN